MLGEIQNLINIRNKRKNSGQQKQPTEAEKLQKKLDKKKAAYVKECKNSEFLINTVLSRVGAHMDRG